MQTVKLSNGVEMPLLGYGVFLVPPQEAERCVADALSIGYCLAAVSMAYYRRAMENGYAKFERFARNVWGVNTAEAGMAALRDWMIEIGLPLTISELGSTDAMIDGITETTVVYPAGYLNLSKDDVREILKESL